jgi:hypothetical protein
VVWRGHVGIAIDVIEHMFYSSVHSGLRTEYYDEPYWREQGRPHFYRYVLLPRSTHRNHCLRASEQFNGPGNNLMTLVNIDVADAPRIGQICPQRLYRRHLHPYQRRP